MYEPFPRRPSHRSFRFERPSPSSMPTGTPRGRARAPGRCCRLVQAPGSPSLGHSTEPSRRTDSSRCLTASSRCFRAAATRSGVSRVLDFELGMVALVPVVTDRPGLRASLPLRSCRHTPSSGGGRCGPPAGPSPEGWSPRPPWPRGYGASVDGHPAELLTGELCAASRESPARSAMAKTGRCRSAARSAMTLRDCQCHEAAREPLRRGSAVRGRSCVDRAARAHRSWRGFCDRMSSRMSL
jgi:hypothetical protein